MADQTEEQRRYQSDVTKLADEEADDIRETAQKVPAHEGQSRTTRSTEGSAETTTTEKK
jgi:hypothetical protein